MRSNIKALLAAAGVAAFAFSPANAYEALYPGWSQKPGALIGSSAGVPPPGIYMINQVFTYQTNLSGPGTQNIPLGNHNAVQAAVDVQAFLFVPGWTFLGGNYDFIIGQPFEMFSIGGPLSVINPAVPSANSGVVRTGPFAPFWDKSKQFVSSDQLEARSRSLLSVGIPSPSLSLARGLGGGLSLSGEGSFLALGNTLRGRFCCGAGRRGRIREPKSWPLFFLPFGERGIGDAA